MFSNNNAFKTARTCTWVVILGLAISGITAFPIENELTFLVNHSVNYPAALQSWLLTVHNAVGVTNRNYPYLSYGTDWLAFAHLMLAILFIGVLKDPIKNRWIIEFGIICCVMIFPLALIAGPVRGIPFFWRLIDCTFGVAGLIPLLICYKQVKEITSIAHV